MQTHMYTYEHVCIYAQAFKHKLICPHVSTHTCKDMYMFKNTCSHTCVHTNTHIHKHESTVIYAYI